VDVRREPHFRCEGYIASWKAGAIGLLDRKLKVRCFYGVVYFLAQLRKKPCNHIVSGKPLTVLRFKEFFSNHALSVDEEISRARHTLVLAHGLDVENLVGTKDFGVRVGEQGKINLPAVRKVFQNGLSVIADRREFDSLLFESCFCVLQLNQLPFAVGSPVRGTEKQENRSVSSLQTVQRLVLAKLVASRKCRRLLSDGETNRSE